MILVDTNVLVALVDPRDGLHSRAVADLKKLIKKPLAVTTAVLVEACFALPSRHHRARLRAVLREFGIKNVASSPAEAEDVFAWLDRYHEHEPDWADGHLAVLSGLDKTARVWTYDREFTKVWRRPDGTRVPLATKS
jgi:predicted nucleic acid-binding protein